MIESLKAASPAPLPCKICASQAPLYGAVDFHKCCEENRGFRLPLSGVPIHYRRCGACGFVFTDAFDDWSDAQFRTHIYNSAYIDVDPDYREARPRANATMIMRLLAAHKTDLRVLDFGGGSDMFCATLRANGFGAAVTYDAMVPEFAVRPGGKFGLITCFETLEHLPDPLAGIGAIAGFLEEPGLALFSTLVQPADFDKQGLDWWYAGPRNGHISLFTRNALAIAWGRRGYKIASFNDNLHVAFRTLPTFAAHFIKWPDCALP